MAYELEVPKELLLPYQLKLAEFLAPVPAIGGEVSSKGADGNSNPVFTALTTYTQQALLTKWKTDRTTTCNVFCSQCANAMGFKALGKGDNLGRFDIADVLTRYGRGHCWITPESGDEPQYGDIFRLYSATKDHNGMELNHMGVSLRVVDGKWLTVEAGQGGPSKGYDAVARKEREWKPDSLQGWVSMKALLQVGKLAPFWLGGWWEITDSRNGHYYYWFGSDGVLVYSADPPRHPAEGPVESWRTLRGTWEENPKRMFQVMIRWNGPDDDEVFDVAQDMKDNRKFSLSGQSPDKTMKFKGKRLMIKGLL